MFKNLHSLSIAFRMTPKLLSIQVKTHLCVLTSYPSGFPHPVPKENHPCRSTCCLLAAPEERCLVTLIRARCLCRRLTKYSCTFNRMCYVLLERPGEKVPTCSRPPTSWPPFLTVPKKRSCGRWTQGPLKSSVLWSQRGPKEETSESSPVCCSLCFVALREGI